MRVESMKKYKVNEETERVIEKDDSASSITTDCEDSKPYSVPCFKKLALSMESSKFQIAILTLVMIDLVIVLMGLLAEKNIFYASDDYRSVVCPVLHYSSLLLMAVFNVELLLRLFYMRLEFFKRWLEVFDGVVIVITFTLDIVFYIQNGTQSAVGLLIVLRLWRIWKIFNFIMERTILDLNRQLRHEKRRKEAVERELNKYRQYCTLQDKEITFLQNLLKKYGISFSCVENPTVGETISVVVEMNKVAMDAMNKEEREVDV